MVSIWIWYGFTLTVRESFKPTFREKKTIEKSLAETDKNRLLSLLSLDLEQLPVPR